MCLKYGVVNLGIYPVKEGFLDGLVGVSMGTFGVASWTQFLEILQWIDVEVPLEPSSPFEECIRV